jgi:FkbM family methyltransferase
MNTQRIVTAVRYARALAGLAPDRRAALRNAVVTLEHTTRSRLGLEGAIRRLVIAENGRRIVLFVEDISDIHAVGEVFLERTYALPSRAALALEGGCDAVADLGSHIGASVAWLSAHHPEARILAFEPDPRSFRKLAAVAARRPGVEVLEAAVAASPGRRDLSCPPGRHIASSLHGAPDGEPVEVECVTLDGACGRAGFERVDLLKLDIEGSELEVLRSFQGLNQVRVVMGEFHPELAGAREELEAALAGFRLEWEEQAGGDPLFVAVNSRFGEAEAPERSGTRGSV